MYLYMLLNLSYDSSSLLIVTCSIHFFGSKLNTRISKYQKIRVLLNTRVENYIYICTT